jgi:hypothetical protein
MFFIQTIHTYVACSRTIQFVLAKDEKQKILYTLLIKGLILFFINIVIIGDVYSFKGSILINY